MNMSRTIVILGAMMLGACGPMNGPAVDGETQSELVVHPDSAPWSTVNPASCNILEPGDLPCIKSITFGYASAGIHWTITPFEACGPGPSGQRCSPEFEQYNLRWGPLAVSRGRWLQGNFGAEVRDVSLNTLEANTPYGVIIQGKFQGGPWSAWTQEIDFQTTP